MKFFFAVCIALLLAQNISAQEAEKENYMECAAYYFTLSIFSPSLVQDLSADQAVKASFALRAKYDGEMFSTKSNDVFMKKWGELDGEIARPVTAEEILKFRSKYDNTCRALLKPAWCDAYKDMSAVACAN